MRGLLLAALLLLLASLPQTTTFEMPEPPQSLYGPEDGGIVSLTGSEGLKSAVLGSNRAWLVEFYSSWCGHCISFAPTFKKLGQEVQDWSHVISLGAIDCAQESNTAVCRDFEIMGYPTLKFFPPNAPRTSLGEKRETYNNELDSLKADMLKYVATVAKMRNTTDVAKRWPVLEPAFQSASLAELWPSFNQDPPFALVVVHSNSFSSLAREAMMDMANVAFKLPSGLVLRRVSLDSAPQELVQGLGIDRSSDHFGVKLFAVGKSDLAVIPLTPVPLSSKSDLVKALQEYVLKDNRLWGSKSSMTFDKEVKNNGVMEQSSQRSYKKVLNEAEIKRRRYTVAMADLEGALLYSLGHEVVQHSAITGDALNALQDFLDVLVRYFPGRSQTMLFLRELRTWAIGHDDVIKGEDMSKKIVELKRSLRTFRDTPGTGEWIGCKGSEPRFGGYPCSFWMLWHTLTVSQATERSPRNIGDPRVVLNAMMEYMEQFFGCRDCARHFKQASEAGEAVRREVHSAEDAMLWLWKTHNKVNKRLSGDITDDAAFPKETFPNPQHCSDCYDSRVGGSDLWSEFRIPKVSIFLKTLYGKDNISMQGLDSSSKGGVHHRESHDLSIYSKGNEAERVIDKSNYDKETNKTSWLFFSPMDFSLMFFVYIISAVIILVYFKFVVRRKSCCMRSLGFIWSNGNHYTKTNELLGKV